MAKTRLTRETLLPLLAAHVLENGLNDASLRPLARAAGTSDRMLIYHFGNKQALVAALLEYLAAMFAASLDSAFPPGRADTRRACVEQVLEITGQAAFQQFFRLWWDIVAGCAAGNRAYLQAAGSIMDLLLQWVTDHLPADDPDPQTGARLVLTQIEGAQMLAAIGREDIGKGGLSALET